MNEEALETLELKLAYLENANTELSDVVYRQQRELEALRLEVISLAGRIEAFRLEQPGGHTPEDERPPHY